MANVKIKGLSSLEAKLKKLEPLTREAASRGVGMAGEAVVSSAKRFVRKDTGELQRSINSRRVPIPYGARAVISTSVEHAIYNEFGTSKMSAQPFLQPALQSNKNKARKIVMTEIVKAHRSL